MSIDNLVSSTRQEIAKLQGRVQFLNALPGADTLPVTAIYETRRGWELTLANGDLADFVRHLTPLALRADDAVLEGSAFPEPSDDLATSQDKVYPLFKLSAGTAWFFKAADGSLVRAQTARPLQQPTGYRALSSSSLVLARAQPISAGKVQRGDRGLLRRRELQRQAMQFREVLCYSRWDEFAVIAGRPTHRIHDDTRRRR